MKKLNIFLILLLTALSVNAWASSTSSKQLTIDGSVQNIMTFSVEDLQKLNKTAFEGVDVYCQSGELKDQVDRLSGVPLKTLIQQAGLKVSKGKDLRKIAFIAKATDDYWVTFSYGEIFNQVTTTPVLVYFSKNGELLNESEGAIALMPMNDERMGGRQVKWLQSIEVRVLDKE